MADLFSHSTGRLRQFIVRFLLLGVYLGFCDVPWAVMARGWHVSRWYRWPVDLAILDETIALIGCGEGR